MSFRPMPWMAAMAATFALSAPSSATAQDPAEHPDTEELTTFTEAFVEIAQVREEMTPRIAAAETPEEATQLQAEANDAMIAVLEEREIEPDRYNTIAQLINADPELRAEFEEILAEITGLP